MVKWVRSEIEWVSNTLAQFGTEWDDFWQNTFPGLIDNLKFWDNWNIGILPITDAINRLNNIVDAFTDFFEDPETWLLDKIKSMLARFI